MTSLAASRQAGLPMQSRLRPPNIEFAVQSKAELNKSYEQMNGLNASNVYSDADHCFGPKQQSTPKKLVSNEMQNITNQLTLGDIEIRTYVLKLLEDLESNINNDNFGKSTTQLIANVCNYLKEHGSYLDEDSIFKEQMDVYFNLLRNILRNQKLDRLSRAFILEVIELRASNWIYNEDIDYYYRNKISDLESNDSYSSMNEMSRGLKTSQSSGSIICSAIGNEIVKSSGKFVKPTKVAGKTFLKDEVVIRNCDSGKVMGIKGRRVHMIEEMSDTVISFQRVNPGAKERLVQITGQTEDNIERAKELIENTIKRNASPVPFECSSKPYESSLNQIDNQLIENEMFETQNMESNEILSSNKENKMPYSFTVNIGDEVIQLSTKNYSIGHEAKQILEKYWNKPLGNEDKYEAIDSDSDDNTIAHKKEIIIKTIPIQKEVGFSLQRQSSATKIESFGNEFNRLQRSSSQGNVPIGRTSLRYLNNKIHEIPEYVNNRTQNLITYDRDFLMSCAKSPLSQKTPTIISKIANTIPDIIRDYHQKQTNSLASNTNQSASALSPNNNFEQW